MNNTGTKREAQKIAAPVTETTPDGNGRPRVRSETDVYSESQPTATAGMRTDLAVKFDVANVVIDTVSTVQKHRADSEQE